MKNFRIWSESSKKCEAVWLGNLLTLCGCQVWRGQLSRKNLAVYEQSEERRYVDILLFRYIDWGLCSAITRYNRIGVYLASGSVTRQYGTGAPEIYRWGICEELQIDMSTTLKNLLKVISPLIADRQREREAILKLTDHYVQDENLLIKSIYAITDLFCSRRINYSVYKNKDILLEALHYIEVWHDKYISTLNKIPTYTELFVIVHIRNLINEGYIKARKRGGYNTSFLLEMADSLQKMEHENEAVLLLRLRILHNCINYNERLERILKKIQAQSAPEYVVMAYCELGDMFREEESYSGQQMAIMYYEELGEPNAENYQAIYKLGLLYEDKGYRWYHKAKKKYEEVCQYLKVIDREMRTPNEFEYYYKALYGKVKLALRYDEMNGILTEERKNAYQIELEDLLENWHCYSDGYFLNKLYGQQDSELLSRNKILDLMDEKMSGVRKWAENLTKDKLEMMR